MMIPSAAHSIHLQFYDVNTIIRSDSSSFIQLLGRMYRRFMVENQSPGQPPLEFVVLTRSDHPLGRPVLILAGEVWDLHSPYSIEFVYDVVFKAILERVRSHFLFHAGVVAHKDQGILLVADSGHGKTTLVLELVRRGFQFLSDEMAPLSCSDRLVYPFPRALRIRPGTLALAGFPEPRQAFTWVDKLILDIEEIRPGSLGQAARIKNILLLKSPLDTGRQVEGEFTLFLDRMDEQLVSFARQLDEVKQVIPGQELGYPVLRVESSKKMRVIPPLEEYCRSHQILIVDIQKRRIAPACFEQPSRLEAIPTSQAALELLRQYQPSHKSALLREVFAGSSTRFYTRLVSLLDGVKCFQLTTGPLEDMADHISHLVNL